MAKILIAYTTLSGSTGGVAEAIAEELRKVELEVETHVAQEITDLTAYDAVIMGGPMIFGWDSRAVKFLKTNQETLSQKPTAYFITCLELVRDQEETFDGVPLFLDPDLGRLPQAAGKLSFKEKRTSVSTYLGPVLKKVPQIKPTSVAFFKGKLDYSQLNILQKLFVRFVIRASEGDFRNWDAIRSWADSLKSALNRPT